MAVKGVLHPADAEKAVALGIDGIWVSNHGGRQIEALTPSIDCLPAVAAAVGKKATILLDSGIRSGQDVMRALALGADAAMAGKSFLWAVAALGDEGPAHLIDLYIDELRASLGQIGAHTVGRGAQGHHPPSRRDRTFGDRANASARQTRQSARLNAATLPCAARNGDSRRAPLEGAAAGSPEMSAVAETIEVDEPHSRDQRRAGAPQRHGAGGGAGARRRQQHRHRLDRLDRRRRARARQGPRHAADHVHGARHVARHAADRLSRPPLRPPLCAADRLRLRRSLGPHLLQRGDARQFLAAARRHVLRRALCRRAQLLPFRRRRHRERCLPAEGGVLGAGRRRVRRHHRAAARHPHQGSAVALHLCRQLSRPVGLRAARRAGADARQNPAARQSARRARPPARRDRARSRASWWRSPAASPPIP